MPGIGSNKNNPLNNFPDLVAKNTVVADNTRVVLPIKFKHEPPFKDNIALKAVKNSSFSPVAKICEQKMAIPDPVELINEFNKFTESTSNGPKILTSKARELGKLMDKVLADPKARAR